MNREKGQGEESKTGGDQTGGQGEGRGWVNEYRRRGRGRGREEIGRGNERGRDRHIDKRQAETHRQTETGKWIAR